MAQQTSPSHKQGHKSVQFELYENGRFAGVPSATLVLPINPEELSYDRMERVNVVQTLGAPFVDDFGVGLPRLRLSGVTGWKTLPNGMDGHAAFQHLHRKIMDAYFKVRTRKLNGGQDPDSVRLVVVNNVDGTAFDVVPGEFHLRRNRTRPLLYQYDLTMTVAEDLNQLSQQVAPDALSIRVWDAERIVARFEVLEDVLDAALNNLDDAIGPTPGGLMAALRKFVADVKAFITTVKAIGGRVASLSKMAFEVIATAAAILDRGLSAVKSAQWFVATLTLPILVAINDVYSAINEIKCHFSQGVAAAFLPDFSKIYGVNDCASTRGVVPGSLAQTAGAFEWSYRLYEFIHSAGDVAISGQGGSAPLMIDADFAGKGNAVLAGAGGFSSAGSVEATVFFGEMSDLVSSIEFDADKVVETRSEDIRKITQHYSVTVRDGDTLQGIALRELGSARRWLEIVHFNDIRVETPRSILLPILRFTLLSDIPAGSSVLDYGAMLPSEYAKAGDVLEFRDANGQVQRSTVAGVEGNTITLNETFSRMMSNPVVVTRWKNMASQGSYAHATTLTAAFNVGSTTMFVGSPGDIYPGSKLYVAGTSLGKIFTVVEVNRLTGAVTVAEPSPGYPAARTVEIFDTETRLAGLAGGMELKIPVVGGAAQTGVQSETEIFGTDLQVMGKKLLVVSGRFGTISGLANFKQALVARLSTPYGMLEAHPDYGCGKWALLGKKASPVLETMARAVVVDGLNKEPRVSQVTDLKTAVSGDVISLALKVQAVDRNTEHDLNFVVGI